MKLTRRQLNQLILEMSGYRYKDYGGGAMGYSDMSRVKGDHLGRAEGGGYQERINLPEPEVKISNNASNALYAFNYPWRVYGKAMEVLENIYGHVTGHNPETGTIYFYNMETGEESEINIHEALK